MVGTRRRTAAAGLLLAVIADDLAAVQQELAQPSPRWVSEEGGLTALHLAAGFASGAVLSALLEAASLPPGLVGARLQADYMSESLLHPLLDSATKETRLGFAAGATALHIAVFFGDSEAVRLLLAAGAPPNAPDAYGATAVHYATCTWLHHLEGSPRLPRRAASHADIPALLLQAGGDIFSPTASSNGTPVHSPLAALADYTPSDAALHAFLQYAGDQHEAGAWVPPAGLNMDRLRDPEGDALFRRAAADCMELFAEAGARPHVYRNIRLGYFSPVLHECDPVQALPTVFDIHGRNSWLWRAYQRPAWTPASHSQFQPRFQEAVRTLLLAAHRAAHQPGHCTAAALGSLPQDVLLHIIGAAARPASAWM